MKLTVTLVGEYGSQKITKQREFEREGLPWKLQFDEATDWALFLIDAALRAGYFEATDKYGTE